MLWGAVLEACSPACSGGGTQAAPGAAPTCRVAGCCTRRSPCCLHSLLFVSANQAAQGSGGQLGGPSPRLCWAVRSPAAAPGPAAGHAPCTMRAACFTNAACSPFLPPPRTGSCAWRAHMPATRMGCCCCWARSGWGSRRRRGPRRWCWRAPVQSRAVGPQPCASPCSPRLCSGRPRVANNLFDGLLLQVSVGIRFANAGEPGGVGHAIAFCHPGGDWR